VRAFLEKEYPRDSLPTVDEARALAAAHRAAMELFSKGEERAERDIKESGRAPCASASRLLNPESKRNPQSTHAPMAIDGVAAWPPRGPALGSRFFAWAGSVHINVMTASRPFTNALELLRAAHLRPTRQRLALVRLLFEQGDRHVTAERLHGEAVEAAVRVSLATVYNTLHQFIEAGLLREVVVNSGRSYFDTNVSDHHHFFFEDTCRLLDIPGEHIAVSGLPKPPAGAAIRRIDVIIRVDRDPALAAD